MPQAVRKMLENGPSYDETDRMSDNIHVSILDIVLYLWAIVSHFVDLGLDLNVAIRYYMDGFLTEFLWTLAFILIPAVINSAIAIHMHCQDKSLKRRGSNNGTTSNTEKILRVVAIVLLMAPVIYFTEALIYAIKSRCARLQRPGAARRYYKRMLDVDSDAALLRVVECFLEAAPQQVLQLTLLYGSMGRYTLHQWLSIGSSMVSIGWCLAGYQRAIRFAQEDKLNMSWLNSGLQTLWHFLVTLSRITAISIAATLLQNWCIVAVGIHVLIMILWLQCYDRPTFCGRVRLAEFAFSVVLAFVYIFSYVIPTEGRTRVRFAIFYTLCFAENVLCVVAWALLYPRGEYYAPVLVISVAPFLAGMAVMVMYYGVFHPKTKCGDTDGRVFATEASNDFVATIKSRGHNEDDS